MNALKTYLESIAHITPSDKEHTHRSALETLLNSLKDSINAKIQITHEPNNDKEDRGAPDFLITLDSLALGYIENKRVNDDLYKVAKSAQIQKYLELSPNIILTDYLRFLLIRTDEKSTNSLDSIRGGGGKTTHSKAFIAQEIRICEYSALQSTLKNKSLLESKSKELEQFFAIFFSATPKPINTALEFANALALRTRLLNENLLATLKLELDSEILDKNVARVYAEFQKELYKDLGLDDFCDSFAQTLTYSLFLARLNSQGEKIDLYNAKKHIPKSFPLIRELSNFLNTLDDLDSIKWLLGEIVTIVNHIDIAQIITELNKQSEKNLLGEQLHKDPYLHFYETFLSQYNPRLRELRGVYYTPSAVVGFIIDSIDLILKKDFKQSGLKSALDSESITLLDFATGTGTFLFEAFKRALQNIPKNSPKYNPKALLNRFFGFEFLIAPYIISHLRISQAFSEANEFNAPLKDNERIGVYLTNTLQYLHLQTYKKDQASVFDTFKSELEKEFEKAQETKEKEILIITGNPPYNGSSINAYDYTFTKNGKAQKLSKIQAHYFYCGLDESKNPIHINEKNPKWLQDDYVKFIRFAESKIQEQDSGIIAIITNHSFLDNPTFRGMRWHLLNSFDKAYFLDLHGNVKKKEKAPDGSKDENVFDIQQGVAISVFIKLDSKHKAKPAKIFSDKEPQIEWQSYANEPKCEVYHYDLFGKRKDKYAFLQDQSLESITWQKINPKPPFYLFIPQNENLKAEYDKGWSVKDIFRISGVGICSKRDHIVFQNSKEKLKELLQDFITQSKRIYQNKMGYRNRFWRLEIRMGNKCSQRKSR